MIEKDDFKEYNFYELEDLTDTLLSNFQFVDSYVNSIDNIYYPSYGHVSNCKNRIVKELKDHTSKIKQLSKDLLEYAEKIEKEIEGD